MENNSETSYVAKVDIENDNVIIIEQKIAEPAELKPLPDYLVWIFNIYGALILLSGGYAMVTSLLIFLFSPQLFLVLEGIAAATIFAGFLLIRKSRYAIIPSLIILLVNFILKSQVSLLDAGVVLLCIIFWKSLRPTI